MWFPDVSGTISESVPQTMENLHNWCDHLPEKMSLNCVAVKASRLPRHLSAHRYSCWWQPLVTYCFKDNAPLLRNLHVRMLTWHPLVCALQQIYMFVILNLQLTPGQWTQNTVLWGVTFPVLLVKSQNYTADAWKSKHNCIIIIIYIADNGNS